jgi:hypothetical protein
LVGFYQNSIIPGSYTLDPCFQVRLEKVHKTGKQGIFEKIPQETEK